MLTKFIGSSTDFINASKIGLAYVANNMILIESQIPQYLLDNPIFTSMHLVNRNSNNEFLLTVTTDIKFNYIVMYSSDGTPLGFTNLNQEIDTDLFKMKTIKILFEFTIINEVSMIEINYVDYTQHISNLNYVHQNLFNSSQKSKKAINKLELNKLTPKRSPYTSSIFSLVRDANLIHRYSGNISKGFKNIVSNEVTINPGDINYLVDFFIINNKRTLVCLRQNVLSYYVDNNTVEARDLGFHPTLIGSNFIVNDLGSDKALYATEDVINVDPANPLIPITTLTNEDNVVIDPIEKDVMIYTYKQVNSSYRTIPKSEKLKRILSELNLNYINFKLRYATKGLLIWFEPISNSSSNTTKLLTYYSDQPYTIQGEVKDVIVLTKDLLLYKLKGDVTNTLYLFEINKNPSTNSYESKSYVLGSTSNNKYRRLDKISRNRPRDIQNVKLTNISSEGCIWSAYKDTINNKYKLTRL